MTYWSLMQFGLFLHTSNCYGEQRLLPSLCQGMLSYAIELEILRIRVAAEPLLQDCGGASGFQEFMEALNPEDPEHRAMAAW